MTAERVDYEVVGQGLLRAATRAWNLCFAGVVATSSIVFQSWPLFGASVAGYATLVAWDLSRVGFWQRVLQELRTRPPPLPDPDQFTDGAARHFTSRLHAARAELRRVLGEIRTPLPERMLSQMEVLPQLERRAAMAIARLEQLSRYLCDKNVRGLRNEVDRVRRAAESAPTPRLRGEFTKAHVALNEELRALEQIAASKDLLAAKLETLTGTLEMVPAAIVRVQVVEADVREGLEDLPLDPRALLADNDTFESLLDDGYPRSDDAGVVAGGKVMAGG